MLSAGPLILPDNNNNNFVVYMFIIYMQGCPKARDQLTKNRKMAVAAWNYVTWFLKVWSNPQDKILCAAGCPANEVMLINFFAM